MENSSSSANSFKSNYNQQEAILCHCRKPTKMTQSWTDEKPGRMFFRCDTDGFSMWADKEKPYGWQKVRLIEAREQIRRQKEEIRELEAFLRETQQGLDSRNSANVTAEMFTEEKKKLEFEAMASKEREKLLRHFVVVSWGGFIVVAAMILTMVKK
ncbi:uncharacterized protein LOC112083003 [Eutrema salsugineum]|uniref:uncharacterized protein LOC112083003 n=1 Tax=Eutrema salsugineum TaxID=72664 RepID=UPI000CED0853|nr:uncharacterized protein LOC112083003 [Eutrema salsugineum]